MPRVAKRLLLYRQCFLPRTMSTESWPKIILFGDSITQSSKTAAGFGLTVVKLLADCGITGDDATKYSFSSDGCWGALLADHVQRKCDVISRGFSGYNVRWCRLMLPQLVTKDVAKNAAAITVFLGANDSNDFETNARQHVPLTEYKEGLTAMAEYLLSVGFSRDKIIFISPPAFCAEEWEKECIKKGKPLSKNNQTTAEYAKACVAVARECGTQVVDLYTEMMNTPDWESLLNDGLHLSSSGSHLLFSRLQPIIEQLTSSIPIKFPFFDEVDLHDLKSSLTPFKQ